MNGSEVILGNRRLMEDRGMSLNGLASEASRLSGEGKTSVFVGEQGKVVGLIALSDTPRETAQGAVQALKRMGLQVAMITGDNEKIAVEYRRPGRYRCGPGGGAPRGQGG